MPNPLLISFDNSGEVGSSERNSTITVNNSVADQDAVAYAFRSSVVLSWNTAVAANGTAAGGQALGMGSTDTNIASGALAFTLSGVPTAKAAVTTGTAIGAQTVPADTWAAYSLDIVAAGTITVSAAAANATTGYATEALAIAAVPVRVTVKARMGYITVKTKAATAWVAATDALQGGASGNPASATNYYPADGVFAAVGVASQSDMTPYTGGRNGVTVASVLSRGSTDTNVATTAFLFNARGISDLPKAAVAAGTAFGALGTIPADTWGLIVMYINSLGTITYQSAPSNYTTGYGSETAAKNDLPVVPQTANLCRVGYVTIKTKTATAFIVGTDALAGGASGNPASITNYYPQAGVTTGTGATSAQIAALTNQVITA